MPNPYYSDDKIDQIHAEIQKDVEKKKNNPIKKIPPSGIIFLTIAIIIIAIIGMNKDVDIRQMLFIVGLIAAVVIFLGNTQESNEILTEQQCKAELYIRLKWKQKNPLGMYRELPDGEIQIDAKTRLRFYEGKPWKRYSEFNIITTDGLTEIYYAAQDPYTGDIIEINEARRGFDPSKVQDIVMIASPELMKERRWNEYGGKM